MRTTKPNPRQRPGGWPVLIRPILYVLTDYTWSVEGTNTVIKCFVTDVRQPVVIQESNGLMLTGEPSNIQLYNDSSGVTSKNPTIEYDANQIKIIFEDTPTELGYMVLSSIGFDPAIRDKRGAWIGSFQAAN